MTELLLALGLLWASLASAFYVVDTPPSDGTGGASYVEFVSD